MGRVRAYVGFHFLRASLGLLLLSEHTYEWSTWKVMLLPAHSFLDEHTYILIIYIQRILICKNERPAYHAACKDEYRPLNLSNSQLMHLKQFTKIQICHNCCLLFTCVLRCPSERQALRELHAGGFNRHRNAARRSREQGHGPGPPRLQA